jgi:phosphate transport system permease protein
VLWSLALVLLAMSLAFILIVHLIGRKGAKING